MNNIISIKDKVVYVSGAFGQIGKYISKIFLKQGAKVIFADIDILKKENVISELLTEGFTEDQFLVSIVDICKQDSINESVINTLEKFGRIDTLINNAAIDAKFDKHASLNETRFEDFPISLLKKSLDVNTIGTIQLTQIVCKQMLKQNLGNIINVASTYSKVSPNQNLYNFGSEKVNFKPIDYIASKSFIPNFTRYIATFYAKNNIRCNTIIPHGIYNDHSEDFLRNWEKLSPIGRMCKVEELTGPFTFLISDSSSYMTGSELIIDGGWTAW